jgi:predicted permease
MLSSLRTVLLRLGALLSNRRLDEEFDQEVQAHLILLTEENIRRGMTPEDARYAALRSFGAVTQVKESNRERRGLRHAEILLQDLRYALHTMRRNPGFTAVVIMTLALGTGANTAIFQLLDAVRLRALPVSNPQELVEIKLVDNSNRRGGVNRFGQLTNPLWERIRAGQPAFSGMLAWGEHHFNLAGGGQVRYARTLLVSGGFFEVLGVRPLMGRVFTSADDQKGCAASAAVVSYAFWQTEFGGSPSVVGSKISLDSRAVEIVGVTTPSFFGLEVGQSYDVAVPICAEPALRDENSWLDKGTLWWLVVMARLKPGWSLSAANAQLDAVSPGVFQATLPANYPGESVKDYLNSKLAAHPAGAGVSQLRNDYAYSLWLLLGASGLVLLIACANLANLMLARASAREREIAVRLALGASRARLLRQLLTESLLLAALGSLLGLWLAGELSALLISRLGINGNPVFLDLHPNWRVLGFTAGLAILTCVLFGMAAALRATGADPGTTMKSGSHNVTGGRQRFDMRRLLVVAQISLSLVLLAGALLFSRSLRNLLTVDAGFRQSGILIADLNFTRLHLPEPRRLDFCRELLERIRTIPGIKAAATTDIIPIGGNSWSNAVWMNDAGADPSQRLLTFFSHVSPGYFKTLEIPMLAGRDFDDRDVAAGPKAAIVNEAFARQMTGHDSPVGKRFWKQQTPSEPQTLYEIVGVVKNTKYNQMREDFRPIAFIAVAQDLHPDSSANVLLQSRLPLADVVASVKGAVTGVNPQIDVDFEPLRTMIQDSLLPERLMATLSGFFGFLAVLLATLGLYGVISYMVARRTNEIGIRVALGADRARVVRLIMREATTLLAIGLGFGVVLASLAAKGASSLLFGLRPSDPATFAVAGASLAVVALAASYLPALRAARLDPLEALREE